MGQKLDSGFNKSILILQHSFQRLPEMPLFSVVKVSLYTSREEAGSTIMHLCFKNLFWFVSNDFNSSFLLGWYTLPLGNENSLKSFFLWKPLCSGLQMTFVCTAADSCHFINSHRTSLMILFMNVLRWLFPRLYLRHTLTRSVSQMEPVRWYSWWLLCPFSFAFYTIKISPLICF